MTKKNETAAPVGFDVDEDGVVTMDPIKVTTIEETPNDHYGHYYSIQTGKKLQGGGVKTGFAYYTVPSDLALEKRELLINQLRADGYVVVEGVRCEGLQGTHMRRSEALQEQARKRKAHMNRMADNRPAEADGLHGNKSTLKTNKETKSVAEALNQ